MTESEMTLDDMLTEMLKAGFDVHFHQDESGMIGIELINPVTQRTYVNHANFGVFRAVYTMYHVILHGNENVYSSV